MKTEDTRCLAASEVSPRQLVIAYKTLRTVDLTMPLAAQAKGHLDAVADRRQARLEPKWRFILA